MFSWGWAVEWEVGCLTCHPPNLNAHPSELNLNIKCTINPFWAPSPQDEMLLSPDSQDHTTWTCHLLLVSSTRAGSQFQARQAASLSSLRPGTRLTQNCQQKWPNSTSLRGPLSNGGSSYYSCGVRLLEISTPRQSGTWPHSAGTDMPQPSRSYGLLLHPQRSVPASHKGPTPSQVPPG